MLLFLTTAFTFMFGAIIGSFLNVVIYRLPRGESVASPPSHCPSCGTPISWYDNIPIVSWLVLGGKCRACGTSISPKYIIVEAFLGLLGAMLWLKLAAVKLTADPLLLKTSIGTLAILFLLYFAFVCLCVTIALIDLKHLIVPHVLAIPGILLGLASPWIVGSIVTLRDLETLWPPITPMSSLVGALAGAFVVLMIFAMYYMLRGIPGLGGGDLTLMTMMGAWLGWPALFFIFFAASVQGLLATVISQQFDLGLTYDADEVFETEGAMNLDDDDQETDGTLEEPAPEEPEDAVEDTAEDDTAGDDEPSLEVEDQASSEDEHEAQEESEEHADSEEEDAPRAAKVIDTQTGEEIALEVEEDEDGGPLAIPFGPFIVLAALEHFYLGRMLPDSWSMYHMYFY